MSAAVAVTRHAIQRWRERLALYGDEGEAEVLACLRDAVEVGEREWLPFPRQAGATYWRHLERNCLFIVKRGRFGDGVVVTIWVAKGGGP